MKCPLRETRAMSQQCEGRCEVTAEMRPSEWVWEGICRCPEHGTICNYCVPLVNRERNVIHEPLDMITATRKEGEDHVWTRNCVICGESFETKSPIQKAHKECSVIAARIRTNRITKSDRNVRMFKKIQEFVAERKAEKDRFLLAAKDARRAVCRTCQVAYPWSQLVALPVDGDFTNLDPMNIWVVCYEHAEESLQRIYGLTSPEFYALENSSAAYLQQMLDTLESTELYIDEELVLGPDPTMH